MGSVDEEIAEAFAAPVEGWNFAWLDGRASESRPPWSYRRLVKEAAAEARRLLDIDTGGGEFLSSVAPFSGLVVATEGYPPNVRAAARRLLPLGARVVETASAPDNVDQIGTTPQDDGSVLPFASGAFDLVIDRHSSYWPSEVRRVLAPDGRFLTQQRGESGNVGSSWPELFGRPAHAHERFTLAFAVEQLEGAGFGIVRAEEADTPMTFHDLAGVVYYLRMVPWAVEAFDAVGDRAALDDIAETIREAGVLEVRGSHLLIDARRS